MYFEPNEPHKTRSFTKTNEMMFKFTFFPPFSPCTTLLKTFFIIFNVDKS